MEAYQTKYQVYANKLDAYQFMYMYYHLKKPTGNEFEEGNTVIHMK